MKKFKNILILGLLVVGGFYTYQWFNHDKMLKEIIARLEADSRVAEVLVTGVNYDEATKQNSTTIKFLEYDTKGQALEPKYFTFPGNIIQFQSLVVRFDERFISAGDKLRGKSVYLFWKVFCLDGANTKEFPIASLKEVPQGYKIGKATNSYENSFWREFWRYALDQQLASSAGVKNAQIEAPGTMFAPGYLYTIKIEHDGGLRIDTKALPEILKGEQVPS